MSFKEISDKCNIEKLNKIQTLIVDIKGDIQIKELTIEMANTEDNKSAILFPVAKSKENKQSVFVFSDEDVLENSISADSEFVSKNNTLRKEYKVEEGFYALYVPKSKMCYLCELK